MSKISSNPAVAHDGVLFDSMTVMSGAFCPSSNPEGLIPEIRKSKAKGLSVISNNAGEYGFELQILLQSPQVTNMISSYINKNKYFE